MNKKRKPAFRDDLCDFCGLCFHLCPVLELTLEEAKEEIQNLVKSDISKYVLSRCNTCLSCNLYCPHEANPYQLILERWNTLYKERGAPPLYRFVCPTEDGNIWQLLNLFLSNKEKKWIQKWMYYTPKPEDLLLLIGSYTHLFPFIIGGSKLLEYFSPIDRIDQWEGGAYLYQGGFLDIVKKIAERTKNDFNGWGAKNIVASLDALDHLFTAVHPLEMGVHHSQNFINFHQWLLDNITSGEISLPNKLDITITVHDNCYSKAKGNVYWEQPRNVLEKCGCSIIEMKHIKQDSLCCGFGAGASWVKNISLPFDMISEGAKKFKEAEETGASTLVTYCSGCLYLMWATKELLNSKIDLLHIVEVVRLAMGEKLNYPLDHVKRAWDIIAIITYSLLLSTLKKNFYIRKLTYDRDFSSFKPRNHIILKIIRYLFDLKLVRVVYSKLFQLIMPIMRSN
ncbi:MAG: (Fe-S)-binding protein [Candidatus Hermodarchaeota archaeon]